MSEKSYPIINVGEKVTVYCVDQAPRIMSVLIIPDDNAIFLSEPQMALASKHFPRRSAIISVAGNLSNIKLSAGDKVTISTSKGKIEMYVSYLIGKTGLVLNYKKVPIKTSIKWLLRFL